MNRRLTAWLAAAALVAGATAPVSAYLHLSISIRGRTTPITWSVTPVRWVSSGVDAPGVTASQFQSALNAAFATWEAVPTSRIAFQYGGVTAARPSDDNDGLNVMGFEAHEDLERTLAATSFTFDTVTGAIVESDVFFNTAFPWSTSGAATAFDLQSVATHEIGHFIGLGHSALGETELAAGSGRRVLAAAAVMFPIAFGRGVTLDRTLLPDDIAGASALYPDGTFEDDTGSLRGRVRMGSRGIFGAHVAAFNLRTGDLVGGFSLNGDGDFEIAGLQPGTYVVRAEPLDDASTDSFFDDPGIEINFRATVHDRAVAVAAGGPGRSFDIVVTPK
jgi:hypothetical protein